MGNSRKKSKIIKARESMGGQKRYGCPFSNDDLSDFSKASGLNGMEAEQALKNAYRQAKAGGDAVNVAGVSIYKGNKGSLKIR